MQKTLLSKIEYIINYIYNNKYTYTYIRVVIILYNYTFLPGHLKKANYIII
jgi:hypothetical protein